MAYPVVPRNYGQLVKSTNNLPSWRVNLGGLFRTGLEFLTLDFLFDESDGLVTKLIDKISGRTNETLTKEEVSALAQLDQVVPTVSDAEFVEHHLRVISRTLGLTPTQTIEFVVSMRAVSNLLPAAFNLYAYKHNIKGAARYIFTQDCISDNVNEYISQANVDLSGISTGTTVDDVQPDDDQFDGEVDVNSDDPTTNGNQGGSSGNPADDFQFDEDAITGSADVQL